MSNRRYIKQRITEPKLKLSPKQIKELEKKFNDLQGKEDAVGDDIVDQMIDEMEESVELETGV